MTDVVDLFAGPGGWSEACRAVGLDELGIEHDPAACHTRDLAGHRTLRADVSRLNPAVDFLGARGLIASPPCPAFSSLGKRHGVDNVAALVAAISAHDWTARPHPDPEVWLMLEVGRWAAAIVPEWIALEQVPAALPVWNAYADVFRDLGYSVWAGVLNAADYGVPQTRKRAVLIASRRRTVDRPPATHQPPPAGPLPAWRTLGEALPELGASGHVNTGMDWKRGQSRDAAQKITADRPAPTFTATSGTQWHLHLDRPATTVMGDPRLWPPGHKINADDIRRLGAGEAARRYGDRRGSRALRLTVEQALALQGFRRDYPVVGRARPDHVQMTFDLGAIPPPSPAEILGRQFEQIGNAVPPPLAEAVIRAAIGP